MNPFSFLQSDMSKRPNTHFGHIQTEHTVQVPGTRLLYHTDSTASRIQTFPLPAPAAWPGKARGKAVLRLTQSKKVRLPISPRASFRAAHLHVKIPPRSDRR